MNGLTVSVSNPDTARCGRFAAWHASVKATVVIFVGNMQAIEDLDQREWNGRRIDCQRARNVK